MLIPHHQPYSKAFQDYVKDRHEVVELLRSAPLDVEQIHSSKKRVLANALYRASVVLLSSHLERYIESLVVEAIDAINSLAPAVNQIPELLRITQIEQSLRAVHLALVDPRDPEKIIEKREMLKLENTFRTFLNDYDQYFNTSNPCNRLDGGILIDRFANPSPDKITQLFKQFGIHNIITRAVNKDNKSDKSSIEGMVKELIDKRNAIAHTGMTTDLTRENVITYLRHSRRLVRGIDIVVSQEVEKILGQWPWSISATAGVH